MPAEVVVEKRERTLISYLLQPMRETIVRAMREYLPQAAAGPLVPQHLA